MSLLVGKITGVSRGVILIRIQPEDVETFRRDFGAGIFSALAAFCSPEVILRIGVVSPDGDFAAF